MGWWRAGVFSLGVVLFAAVAAVAQTPIPLPAGAVQTLMLTEDPGIYELPIGHFTPDATPTDTLEGRLILRSWRYPLEAGSPLSVQQALRAVLEDQGFKPMFACATLGCGGFDFRFGTRVLAPPAMELDLTNFHYLALVRSEPAGRRILSTLLSRSPRGGFAQVIEYVPAPDASVSLQVPVEPVQDVEKPEDLASMLSTDGRAVLRGVNFEPGATALAEGGQDVLAELAEYMVAAPETRLIIVGHTDNQGDLDSNIRVSRQRAAAVRAALIDGFGIASNRLEAAGAGYLAPLVPNDTEGQRALNRRVEVVLR